MRHLKTILAGLASLAALLVGPAAAAAQAQDANSMADSVADAVVDALQPIQRRANDIAGLFRADPGGYDEVFAPPFLSQTSAAALDRSNRFRDEAR